MSEPGAGPLPERPIFIGTKSRARALSAPSWRKYWEASVLAPSTAVEFGERIRSFSPLTPSPEPFAQAAPEVALPTQIDSLQRLFRRRRSTRLFGDTRLRTKDLGRLFSAFSAHNERRTYPSAGGMYPVHVFAMILHAQEPWNGKAVRYEPTSHSLGVMGSLPAREDVERFCSLDDGIHPQMIVVFVIYPDELERKYGERAGRFALMEVGHAAQSLALRITKSGMIGYEIGGVQDTAIKDILGLSGTGGLIAHGYACGR